MGTTVVKENGFGGAEVGAHWVRAFQCLRGRGLVPTTGNEGYQPSAQLLALAQTLYPASWLLFLNLCWMHSPVKECEVGWGPPGPSDERGGALQWVQSHHGCIRFSFVSGLTIQFLRTSPKLHSY